MFVLLCLVQETLAPLYHSGAAGGPGGPKCTPCETSKLICQAPHNLDEQPCTYPASPEVKVSLPLTREMTEKEGRTLMDEQSEGSGGPEEVSEEEEVTSVPPLLAGSCVCGTLVQEPLEVGENEDCSQAVSPGTPGTCSCGGLDGDERGKEERSEIRRAENSGEAGVGDQEKRISSKSETSVASLVSMSPPLLHTSSVIPPSSPLQELCLPLSQAPTRPEFKACLRDRSLVEPEEMYRLASTDSTEDGGRSVTTSVSPSSTSSSVVDLYTETTAGFSSQEQGQGLSWGDTKANKLLSGELDIDCPPKSLQSQLEEPTLTSGR